MIILVCLCIFSAIVADLCQVFGIPGLDTIIHDELLKNDSLIINSTHNILVCLPCSSIINIHNLPAHYQRLNHRDKPKPAKDLGVRILSKFPSLTYTPVHPLSPVSPIFGLETPLKDYLICVGCSRGYQNKESFRHHACGAAQDFYSSDVQTFAHTTQHIYFPVTSQVPQTPESTAELLFRSYTEAMVSRPDFNKVVTVPHNYRELSQFLAKERWLELVQDKDIEALQALVALPTENEQWPLLTRHVFAYMYANQGKIAEKALHSVRRLLGTRPS
jgi:hypothetical protein